MMPTRELMTAAFGLFAVCAMVASCSKNPLQTIVIDKSDCSQYTNGVGSPCRSWLPYGSYTILISGSANACAISFKMPDFPDTRNYQMDGFSYAGPDDWECRTVVPGAAERELIVARMSHSNLTVEYVFDGGQVVPMKFRIVSYPWYQRLLRLFWL